MRDFTNHYPSCKPLSRAEEAALFVTFRKGVTKAEREAARSRLLASITPFAYGVAKNMIWTGLKLDDLVQLAMMGANKGLERFKPERGVRLISYAAYWIRSSLQRGAYETAKTIRIPAHVWDFARKVQRAERALLAVGIEPTPEAIATKSGLPRYKVMWVLEGVHQKIGTLDPPPKDSPLNSKWNSIYTEEFPDLHTPDPVENIDKERLLAALRTGITDLDPDERAVIERRFSEKSPSLAVVGETAAQWSKSGENLSRERVRQIESNAIRKLRHILELDHSNSP